jgi:hypothetical protein
VNEQPSTSGTFADQGVVTVTNRPFVTVRIEQAYVEEWSGERIAQYGADLALWELFGHFRTLAAQRRFTGRFWRWLADQVGVPESRPRDREVSIVSCTVVSNRHKAGILLRGNQ